MDTNGMSGGGEGEQEQPLQSVPERPTPSGWVVVKKARKAKAKAAPKKKAAPARKKRSSSKRELIDTGRNKMYAKRGATGRFKEMDDVGRSLSADRRKKAKTKAKSGYGDQGDGATRRGKKTARKPVRKTARKSARKKARSR
jgi:hypothetical protein